MSIDKKLIMPLTLLTFFSCFVLGCEHEDEQIIVLQISGNTSASYLKLRLMALNEASYSAAIVKQDAIYDTVISVADRDIAADGEPVNIRIKNSDDLELSGEVLICAWGEEGAEESTRTVLMSAAQIVSLTNEKIKVISINLDKGRRDFDHDCFSPDESQSKVGDMGISFYDCDDLHSDANPLFREDCTKDYDNNCNGTVNEGCRPCVLGEVRYCWYGSLSEVGSQESEKWRELTYVDRNGVAHYPQGVYDPERSFKNTNDVANICLAGRQECLINAKTGVTYWGVCTGELGVNMRADGRHWQEEAAYADLLDWQEPLCDGLDNNCDGQIDNSSQTNDKYNFDGDGDGYNSCGTFDPLTQTTSAPNEQFLDCDDADNLTYPGAPLRCDRLADCLKQDSSNGYMSCTGTYPCSTHYYQENGACYKVVHRYGQKCDESKNSCVPDKENMTRICSQDFAGTIVEEVLGICQNPAYRAGTCQGNISPSHDNLPDGTACGSVNCSDFYYGWGADGKCHSLTRKPPAPGWTEGGAADDDLLDLLCLAGSCQEELAACTSSVTLKDGVAQVGKAQSFPGEALSAVCYDERCRVPNSCQFGTLQQEGAEYCRPSTYSCARNKTCDEEGRCGVALGGACSEHAECHSGLCGCRDPNCENSKICIPADMICHYYLKRQNSYFPVNSGVEYYCQDGKSCDPGSRSCRLADDKACTQDAECYENHSCVITNPAGATTCQNIAPMAISACHYYSSTDVDGSCSQLESGWSCPLDDGLTDERCSGEAKICKSGQCLKGNGIGCSLVETINQCYSGHCECASKDCTSYMCSANECPPCKYVVSSTDAICSGNLVAEYNGNCPKADCQGSLQLCDGAGNCKIKTGERCCQNSAACLSGNCEGWGNFSTCK